MARGLRQAQAERRWGGLGTAEDRACRSASNAVADIPKNRYSAAMAMARCSLRKDLRLQSAAVGFGITLVPIAALASAQFLLIPHTVTIVYQMDTELDAWAVSQLRRNVTAFYATAIGMMAIYWLLCAVAGSSQLLRIRSANVALVISGLIFGLAVAVATFARVPEAFRWTCPVFGVSDTFPPLPEGVISFDRQTPCEVFLGNAVPSVLLGLPVVLLFASAVLRIVGSRKQR
jgi:hypothetical protein